MATKKITLAFFTLLTACMLHACNSKPKDKSGMETENGGGDYGNASGSDTSHQTDRTRETVSGVNPKPEGQTKPANGSTTAQGMVGGDSVYLKNTQKSRP
jgi:hypothetical protein